MVSWMFQNFGPDGNILRTIVEWVAVTFLYRRLYAQWLPCASCVGLRPYLCTSSEINTMHPQGSIKLNSIQCAHEHCKQLHKHTQTEQ